MSSVHSYYLSIFMSSMLSNQKIVEHNFWWFIAYSFLSWIALPPLSQERTLWYFTCEGGDLDPYCIVQGSARLGLDRHRDLDFLGLAELAQPGPLEVVSESEWVSPWQISYVYTTKLIIAWFTWKMKTTWKMKITSKMKTI